MNSIEDLKKARKLYRELRDRFPDPQELGSYLLYCNCKLAADEGLDRMGHSLWMFQHGLSFPNNDTVPEDKE